jgi:elongation factor G
LLEAILARTGQINRQGSIAAGNTVGDTSPEAREHQMSIEPNIADATFIDDKFTFIDCPGSIEFQFHSQSALSVCDAAIVVCEADEKKLPGLQLTLKHLTDRKIPHFLFINKIDKNETPIRQIVPMLQPVSALPLVLRQIPIWQSGVATGFVDLALERAFVYREHAPSEVVEIPEDLHEREAEARFSMLEKLADYDDELMEALLSDIEPPRDRVFDDLGEDLREGKICPVLFGSAEKGNGVTRLLKALRHETPQWPRAASRLGITGKAPAAYVFRSYHTPHAGKLSLVRVFGGSFGDGVAATGPEGEERVAGIFSLHGQEPRKRDKPGIAGDVIALGRLEAIKTGDLVSIDNSLSTPITPPAPPYPVYGLALVASQKKDEVKLTASIGKLIDEDPSLSLVHDPETSEMVLWGQGEMHLRITLKQLERRFGVKVETRPRQIPYKETIRKSVEVRGRHKKQSGGHGQFGDVVIDMRPLPRGTGFVFTDEITGGVVPKQYIPSVEYGVKDYLTSGPLGFPVVDVAVCLKDGSYHTVDSSDMAFRAAGRLAMSEGMPKCSPVLLEPVMAIEIAVPSDATSKINGIISSRRGQILGFDARPGWPGWDNVQAYIPEVEMQELIIELRSATAGAASFTASFDHLAEVTGKLADEIVAHNSVAA